MIGLPEMPTQEYIYPSKEHEHIQHQQCFYVTVQFKVLQLKSDLYSPDLGEFVQRQFTPQQLNDSLNSLTVLSLVNVTWNIKIFNDQSEYRPPQAKSLFEHFDEFGLVCKWQQSFIVCPSVLQSTLRHT